jgi:hypothetical protein
MEFHFFFSNDSEHDESQNDILDFSFDITHPFRLPSLRKKPNVSLTSSIKYYSTFLIKNMCASIHTDYEYMNENEIDDELKCVICKQPLESPVSLSICHHTFCKQCIKFWLNRNETCPTCRQEVIRRSGRNNRSFQKLPYAPINTRIVLNQLDRLLIRCLLCNETNIQRCHWKNHEKICLKKTVYCSSADIKCTWKGSRDTLSIHLNNCTFQQVRPIIDELKTELKLVRTTQTQLEKAVNTLENKVIFLLKFINYGNLMTQYCTKPNNECKYNTNGESSRSVRFNCSICHEYIRRENISLHACSGDCICRSCVNSQYPDHRFHTWEPINEQYYSSDLEEDD